MLVIKVDDKAGKQGGRTLTTPWEFVNHVDGDAGSHHPRAEGPACEEAGFLRMDVPQYHTCTRPTQNRQQLVDARVHISFDTLGDSFTKQF